MTRRFAWIGVLAILIPSNGSGAADGVALPNRLHVGRVKTVYATGSRLIIERMFHDRSFREIRVILEPDAPVINPDLMNRAQAISPKEIRPGYNVALECAESGKRHTARKVTITSTEEERLQRALLRASRAGPPGLRSTGGGLR
ncbi:MAG TPA: hypothetical protein VLG48_08360 [Candidatus Methylomirabilis sp.]|nr:hypothetical protein [Candidatus Methylomirabilis sp.]